jgi:sec-independent protein translocase protein TatB
MFDIGADELLLIAVIAIIAIGPKDLPLALRTVGRWVGKIRRVSGHFRSGIEAMIREAELEEMEKKWKEQNDRIMAEHPHPPMTAETASGEDLVPPASAEARAEAHTEAVPPPPADAAPKQD